MRVQKNYQKMLEATIAGLKEQNRVPTLLLHSCCAPCSSYCLEYLSQYFHITVDYYNPNIYPEEEYHMRVQEQQRLIRELPAKYPIAFREGAYDKERFYEMARGMEEEKEGGERCFRCYELRLREAAETAKSLGMDYFTTTLSISPLKNAEKLNEIVRKKKHIVSVSKRSAISYEEPYEGKQRADIRICKTPQLRECQSRDLY